MEVYLNKTRRLFSIRHKGGTVYDWSRFVRMSKVVPRVNEAGRQWTLERDHKVVHAVLDGILERTEETGQTYQDPKQLELRGYERIRYNPKDCEAFVTLKGEEVHFCLDVICQWADNGPEVWAFIKPRSI